MLINKIYTECERRYNNKLTGKCNVCKYPGLCTDNCWDCKDCLYYIHFPDACPPAWPKGRSYDCPYMADFYISNFSCRFTSEMIYALRECSSLLASDELKVLSFGCGPCTDLFAIDCLKNKQEPEITAKKIEYLGIDGKQDVWGLIHKDIVTYAPQGGYGTCFHYADACEEIQVLKKASWTPNLIVFQYFLSDLNRNKKNNPSVGDNFINAFVEYCNKRLQPNTYLVLNDINLSGDYGGELGLFDDLLNQLGYSYIQRHFDDDTKAMNQYGQKFPYNKCFSFGTIVSNDVCTSAQLIMKKE